MSLILLLWLDLCLCVSCDQSVLEKERKGDYLGKTVQVIMVHACAVYMLLAVCVL